MGKIRVLQFPMANAYGGITQYVLQNWKFIDKTRFQFDFATLAKEPLHFEKEVTDQGCRVYHISCYAEENEEQFTREMRQILKVGYDVVHLHTSFWKSFRVEELAREAGIPKIIVHAHNTSVLGTDNREKQVTRHMQCVKALTESVATDYWACSQAASDWLYGNSIPQKRIVIQKNAIDVDRFRYNPEIARQVRGELSWEDQFIIGHVGRFTYQKNHAFLIRVFRQVHDVNPQIRLLLVGVGPERTAVNDMINTWHLKDAVQILSMRTDVDHLLQAVDLFAFPSRFEGFPIVLVEAQAAGCRCLISDRITDEVMLTPEMQRLPLKESWWIDNVFDIMKSYNGRLAKNADIVRNNGYDLKDQIRRIESGYRN